MFDQRYSGLTGYKSLLKRHSRLKTNDHCIPLSANYFPNTQKSTIAVQKLQRSPLPEVDLLKLEKHDYICPVLKKLPTFPRGAYG